MSLQLALLRCWSWIVTVESSSRHLDVMGDISTVSVMICFLAPILSPKRMFKLKQQRALWCVGHLFHWVRRFIWWFEWWKANSGLVARTQRIDAEYELEPVDHWGVRRWIQHASTLQQLDSCVFSEVLSSNNRAVMIKCKLSVCFECHVIFSFSNEHLALCLCDDCYVYPTPNNA